MVSAVRTGTKGAQFGLAPLAEEGWLRRTTRETRTTVPKLDLKGSKRVVVGSQAAGRHHCKGTMARNSAVCLGNEHQPGPSRRS